MACILLFFSICVRSAGSVHRFFFMGAGKSMVKKTKNIRREKPGKKFWRGFFCCPGKNTLFRPKREHCLQAAVTNSRDALRSGLPRWSLTKNSDLYPTSLACHKRHIDFCMGWQLQPCFTCRKCIVYDQILRTIPTDR